MLTADAPWHHEGPLQFFVSSMPSLTLGTCTAQSKHMTWEGYDSHETLTPLLGDHVTRTRPIRGPSQIFWLELEKDPVPGVMDQKGVEVEEGGGLILSYPEKVCLL